ncbi:hypothetical protein GC163_05360 [bacterium]|nr:hypothetical protein [bacterium]
MSQSRVWFHIIISTYGSWLPGDPRGFRTRHHREHVEGDYRNPPADGIYDQRLEQSRQELKQPAVTLTPQWREVVGKALLERLQQQHGRVLAIACAAQHSHIQVQLPNVDARKPVGIAKKHATFVAHAAGFTGQLWSARGKIVRIRDVAHQRNVYRYILDHAREGAWVWSEVIPPRDETQG